jgi:hypothetical protein
LRVIATIVGIALAAIGGVIVYRALYLEPSSAVVVSSGGVRELPNTLRVACGVGLLVIGAVLAFFSARRRTS